nr:VIT family protein [Methylobacterium organophilum]
MLLSAPSLPLSAVERAEKQRAFVLQYVQPGLAGLIDGSVSTLAPIFAAAFATHSNGATFLVGLAASIGAGISMGFTEALSDDGAVTGRGSPLTRGIVCGVMTALGGLGHTLPYAIPDSWPNAFGLATGLAILVVLVELVAIAAVRTRYMATPFVRAALQVVLGGALVLGAGVLIGNA